MYIRAWKDVLLIECLNLSFKEVRQPVAAVEVWTSVGWCSVGICAVVSGKVTAGGVVEIVLNGAVGVAIRNVLVVDHVLAKNARPYCVLAPHLGHVVANVRLELLERGRAEGEVGPQAEWQAADRSVSPQLRILGAVIGECSLIG